nr:Chain A, De novo mini protein gHEEE_02 [synthetic construct]
SQETRKKCTEMKKKFKNCEVRCDESNHCVEVRCSDTKYTLC